MFDFCPQMIETLLASQRPDYGVLPCGWLPLDVDTFAMYTRVRQLFTSHRRNPQ
jgi:hypothetical protein